jgi:hypothetical protein
MMIVNDDSRFVNKLEASETDDPRVIIYNRHMFIVQATGVDLMKLFWSKITHIFCKLHHFIDVKNSV